MSTPDGKEDMIHSVITIYLALQREKEEILLISMTKAPTPAEKLKKLCDKTQTPPKTSIAQRLLTDLGRSVGLMIVT